MAVLQYLAASFPHSGLGASDDMGRARLQQWLFFIGTELHKAMFIPLFDKKSPEGTKPHTLAKSHSRLDFLNWHLTGWEFLLDHFSVADAYLYTDLNWPRPTHVDITLWPAIKEYHFAIGERASVARAVTEAWKLYEAGLARHELV